MDYIENAINKIREEYNKLKGLSQCANVVAPFVRDELEVFCKQDKEFAQAVVQTDKKAQGLYRVNGQRVQRQRIGSHGI